jgi:hypothetical protein
MNWANRICQSLFLINLIYAITSLISNGQFLPIIPLEELFASLMFLATSVYLIKKEKIFSLLLMILGLIVLMSSKDVLLFFFSKNVVSNLYSHFGAYLPSAEIMVLIAVVGYLLNEILKNEKRSFSSRLIPVMLTLLIIIALFFALRFDYLLYFAYLALGLSSVLIAKLYLKASFEESWSEKYGVFGYHALLILTNIFAFF